MINTAAFIVFIRKLFGDKVIYFEQFKPDLFFLEVDCLSNPEMKLSIEVSIEQVKVSAINKKPEIDFSLHDYSFEKVNDAENFLLKIKQSGYYEFPR